MTIKDVHKKVHIKNAFTDCNCKSGDVDIMINRGAKKVALCIGTNPPLIFKFSELPDGIIENKKNLKLFFAELVVKRKLI